jgi:hypothetical protein
MILNIYGRVPSDESLIITINNEVKILNDINKKVSFTINEKKRYHIDIEQKISKSNINLLTILFYLLTIIIQGMFNVLLDNTDSDWYSNIKAYCLKARLLVDMKQDTDIKLVYTNSKYNEKTQMWILPVFKVEPNIISDLSFVPNPSDFINQYFNYIKRVISILIVLISILALILYAAIVNLNNIAIIFTSILIFSAVLLVLIVAIAQYKKLKKLYESFSKQNAVGVEQ